MVVYSTPGGESPALIGYTSFALEANCASPKYSSREIGLKNQFQPQRRGNAYKSLENPVTLRPHDSNGYSLIF